MAIMGGCAGAFTLAWLTARSPGAHSYRVPHECTAPPRRRSVPRPGSRHDCVCGRAAAAGGTHALVCGALWHTVAASHNMMVDAWRRGFTQTDISYTVEPHVKQLPQRFRAAGLSVLPARLMGSHPSESKAACATLTTSELSTSPALAVQLPPRSRRNPEPGDLLALLSGCPIVADMCVTHPLAASAVKAAARDTGATAMGKDSLTRDNYSRTSTGACRFVPQSHETFGHGKPAAFALLNEIAEFVASSGVVSNGLSPDFLDPENAMRDLSTTLCRWIMRQVLDTVQLRARLNGYPVVAGLPMLTNDLIPVACGPS